MTLWFPEPVVADATDGRDDETMAEWLDRSTVPRAVEARRFLNENLAALPEQEQPQFYKLFRERWKSTLFEIIVARTLQTIGSTLVIEPEGFEGKRIDFMASFPDMVVAVEAKAPEMNRTVLQQSTENQPLVEIIKQLIPPGWWVAIARLPNIGARDSKRQFRQRIEAIFARLPPSGQDNETIEVYEELPTGLIMMWIASTSTSPGGIASHPAISYGDNSVEVIKKTVRGARQQARGVEVPVLLAIRGGDFENDMEDFDSALFGRDGVFADKKDGQPTIAGVLAYIQVGFTRGSDPVLYVHPRYSGALPTALTTLEQRGFNRENRQTITVPAQRIDVLEPLHFVPHGI